jgi:hypothetical protein
MPLSRREIRTRATKFAKQWATAYNEDADAKPFWYEFFQVFGIRGRTVGSYEVHVKKLTKADGYIDYFWPGMVLIEHKSRGKDLKKAAIQAVDYLHGVKEHEKPRFILVSDFARFVLYNLESGDETELLLEDFPKRTEVFDFIAGYEARPVREQDPVNIKAAELMGKLHDELKATGYEGRELEVYLVRLLFILFADDTGIFERDAFYNYIVDQTREDGTDVGAQLASLFQLLNTPDAKRARNLDERLADFKYVNGKLFEEHLRIASWDGGMRVTLLECATLDWAAISPAIFGALFQSAMDPKQRRNLGAHYTSEQNILKLIKPLFLDELWDEFNKVKSSAPQLDRFHKKLSELRFLDPACGCGNFLVITYRELRELEIEVIKAQLRGQQVVDVDSLVLLNVDQFYGIEIEEFPAQIAQVALWLVDHQMNQRISAAFGEYMVRIPLTRSATIVCDNALRREWQSLLPEGERYEYILGNPPFIGSKLMSEEMRADIRAIFPDVKGAGTLDFVCGWYGLAAQYMAANGGKRTRTAFVSTNSITQGEQVGTLWGPLLAKGIKIHFAHQTFRWNNEARGVAAVHCVIVGFADLDVPKKRLFLYEEPTSDASEEVGSNISPYLVQGSDVVVRSRSSPLCPVPEIGIGNKPIDGGHYLFTTEQRDAFLTLEPGAKPYFRRWLGSDEFINGWERWCLWLGETPPSELRKLPHSLERIEAVRRTRLASKSAPTRKLAGTPTRFHVENIPTKEYLIIPEVSSERRTFIPIGYMHPDTMASNLVKIVPNATLYHFGNLTSTMHMAWVKYVCGRMKSDYRYSKDIVYNNYPWPENPSAAHQQAVEAAAQGVLDARAAHPTASLADLYDPLTMPPDLVKAHQALDKAVDKCYRPQPFTSDAKRVEFLFELYEKYVAGLLAGEKPKRKKKR